jgi:hypothetical protein
MPRAEIHDDAARRYAAVVVALTKNAKVQLKGPGRKGFGSQALRVGGKIFAMLSMKRQFVVKLPRDRVDELVASRFGSRFESGQGRAMKEWFVPGPRLASSWVALAKEALSFVAADDPHTVRSKSGSREQPS